MSTVTTRRAIALAAAVLSAALIVTPSPRAAGYAEDVCPAPVGHGWIACNVDPGPPLCKYDDPGLCSNVAAATRLIEQTTDGKGARSTLHTDSTYYLAQAAGLSARQALTVAMFDGGADAGGYIHRNRAGVIMPKITTGAYPGIGRTNFAGGGIFFHFMAPVVGRGPRGRGSLISEQKAGAGHPLRHLHGLRPNPKNPFAEPALANYRRWAYHRGPLCVGGLTTRTSRGDYATGSHCYRKPSGGRATMLTSIPFSSRLGHQSDLVWRTPLGQMHLTLPDAKHPVLASQIAKISGRKRAPFARLGIYLHALQDRVSHHICIDRSYSVGPRPSNAPAVVVNPTAYLIGGSITGKDQTGATTVIAHPDFVTTFDEQQCDQDTHDARHDLETGTPQHQIPRADRTAAAGLRITLSELRAFVGSRYGEHVVKRVHVRRRQQVRRIIPALVHTEEVHSPAARLDALTKVGRHRGFRPLPGYGPHAPR